MPSPLRASQSSPKTSVKGSKPTKAHSLLGRRTNAFWQNSGSAREVNRQTCQAAFQRANLVSMTRTAKPPPKPPKKAPRLPGRWPLQDAKARFSELVRRVRSEGPQHVTVHGRDGVKVVELCGSSRHGNRSGGGV